MGREVHILRLAYGRSAFEPPEAVSQAEEERSSRGLDQPPERGLLADYVQLYDEKGHPYNDASRAYGRSLRAAQNDCLAAVGVVIKKRGPRGYHQGSPDLATGFNDEGPCGYIRRPFLLTALENVALAWLRGLQYRMLAFPSDPPRTFVEIVSSQYHVLGSRRFFFAGLPSFLLLGACVQGLQLLNPARALDRIGLAYLKSRSTRERYRQVIARLDKMLPELVYLFGAPLTLHSILQLLGLVPVNQVLPPLQAFHPRSIQSPFTLSSRAGITASLLYRLVCSPAMLVESFEELQSRVFSCVLAALPLPFTIELVPSLVTNAFLAISRIFTGVIGSRSTVEDTADELELSEAGREEIVSSLATGPQSTALRASDLAGMGPPPGSDPAASWLGDSLSRGVRGSAHVDGSSVRISSVDRTEGSMVITVQVGDGIEQLAQDTLEHSAQAADVLAGWDRRGAERLHYPFLHPTFVYMTDLLASHLAGVLTNAALIPVRMVMLQRIATTFQPGYTWSLAAGRTSHIWTDCVALAGPLTICFGLELVTRVGMWAVEARYILWQHWRHHQLDASSVGDVANL